MDKDAVVSKRQVPSHFRRYQDRWHRVPAFQRYVGVGCIRASWRSRLPRRDACGSAFVALTNVRLALISLDKGCCDVIKLDKA